MSARSRSLRASLYCVAIFATPLCARQANAQTKFVVIDPGHGLTSGGSWLGASDGGYHEAVACLNVANEIKAAFDWDPNIVILLTRKDDNNIAWEKRLASAWTSTASSYISIHHDGVGASLKSFVVWEDTNDPRDLLNGDLQPAPQGPYAQQSRDFATKVQSNLCAWFAKGYNCGPLCMTANGTWVNGEWNGCCYFNSLDVLRNNSVKAVLTEACPISSDLGHELCIAGSDAAKSEAHAIQQAIYEEEGVNLASHFLEFGAFDNTAYCLSEGETFTDSLVLRGYTAAEDYPSNPAIVTAFAPRGGPNVVAPYMATVSSSVNYFDWLEYDGRGRVASSGMFSRGNRPTHWDTRYVPGPQATDTLWPPTPIDTTIGVTTDAAVAVVAPVANTYAADIVVYATQHSLGDTIFSQIQRDAGVTEGKKIRLIIGANSSVTACRESLRTTIAANIAWNNYCNCNDCGNPGANGAHPDWGCGGFYPVSPGPEVYIVGEMQDPNPTTASFSTAADSDLAAGCGRTICRSDDLLYDLDGPQGQGDGIPDGPISRIPAVSQSEASLAATYAHEFNAGLFVDPLRRVMFLRGALFNATSEAYEDSANGSLMKYADSTFAHIGYAALPVLNGASYPAVYSPDRIAAFVNQAKHGVREIFGCGGITGLWAAPGNFMYCDPTNVGVAQRVVAWFPGCDIHATWQGRSASSANGCLSSRPLVEQYMFGPSNGTNIAASVAQMDGGMDFRYRELDRYLLAARSDAALPWHTSVARIAYNAVVKAIAEQPWLREHALSMSTFGSYTNIGRTPASYVGTVTVQKPYWCATLYYDYSHDVWISGPSATRAYCPAGDMDSLAFDLRVFSAQAIGTTLPAMYAVRIPGTAQSAGGTLEPVGVRDVRMWDAVSRADAYGDTLRPSLWDAASQTAHFVARRFSGCGWIDLRVFLAGAQVDSTLRFFIRSVDLDARVVGSVDRFDKAYWDYVALGHNGGWLCHQLNNESSVYGDPNVYQSHLGHAGVRIVLSPNGGEQWTTGQTATVTWQRGYGDSSKVELSALSGSAAWKVPLAHALPDTGRATVSVPAGLDTCQQCKIEVMHTAGTYQAGVAGMEAGKDASDSAIFVRDGIAPAAVDLQIDAISPSSVILTWQAPGDDGNVGRAFAYDLRYSTSQITASNFGTTSGGPSLTPQVAGNWESAEVSGLSSCRTYYFAVRTLDERGNFSPMSTVPSCKTMCLGGGGFANAAPAGGAPGSSAAGSPRSGGAGSATRALGSRPASADSTGTTAPDVRMQLAAEQERAASVVRWRIYWVASQVDSGQVTDRSVSWQVPGPDGGWMDRAELRSKRLPAMAGIAGYQDSAERLLLSGGYQPVGVAPSVRVLSGDTLQNYALTSAHSSRVGTVSVDSVGIALADVVVGDSLIFEYSLVDSMSESAADWWIAVQAPSAPNNIRLGRQQEVAGPPPLAFALLQNRPNPFGRSTTIRFDLPGSAHVRLEIFDMQGRRIRRVADESYEAGRWSVAWDGRGESGNLIRPGVYLYRIEAGRFRSQKKMVLLP
ncbi:MAG: N-acetylmuramoyl-L-alanine amidase [Candidatus Eisenbacteria bacterium]|nr:N-acetylmuramoyl-L-alanine amidase [Candidatus Eisenbacteria bacterium]